MDLFDALTPDETPVPPAPGAVLLPGFARADADALIADAGSIAMRAAFRHLGTPGGAVMSVAMTNAGSLGWHSDRSGYRYVAADPLTGLPWPPIPATFLRIAASAAEAGGFPQFAPECVLINRYEPGARLSLHQDRDEGDLDAPIVSVSLGLPAVFLFGGLRRDDPVRRFRLSHGDVAVWGGPARLAFHGIAPLKPGIHPATGACRLNLTFRRVSRLP
ncbi:DNA oxidative demethylase AlkB [Acetobacteraceae bacterium KSS8]|uniref:DNA oxidative demethylase AlkB n=1 Tax=Endosaccharibacter trunci TaxID=2812733 RepID=A0ABT1W2X8_9PROT|nr:DNA oxidative demethylase AlkB [Acetobacteraceae bacterium KSS8]